MQKIVEFSAMKFWSSPPDVQQLNVKISQLNVDGWKVTNAIPNSGFGGKGVGSYTLLIERE